MAATAPPPVDPDAFDPEAEFLASLRHPSGAPETIEVAWRSVMGDEPLRDGVKYTAAEVLIAGGAQGIPWVVVMFDTDPREAIAEAIAEILGDDDPRAELFRAAAAADRANGEIQYEFDRRLHTEATLLRTIDRKIRKIRRGTDAPRRNARPRAPRRRRSSTGTSLGGTDPPPLLDLSPRPPGLAGPVCVETAR